MLQGKIVLTGGTGTLGHAIVEHAQQQSWNAQFTIVSRDEFKQSEMRRRYPDHRYVLGNVTDLEWMKSVMRKHDGVIHAAAYKQVPSAESNSREAVHSNVIGSMNVAEAAVHAGVAWVVGISTDKACAPVNAYGATKMVMEKVFQEAASWSDTRFTLCRYGNVLGSRGSILPLFKQQVLAGGPVTITDRRMTRFWLSTLDAVELVDRAACKGTPNGCIVVPRAHASTVEALADAALSVYGYPHPDVQLSITDIGIRPGEKLHESLIHSGESMHTTSDSFCMYVMPATVTVDDAKDFEFTSLNARQLNDSELRSMVREALP